ncbi:MAG TPA: sel1 repeat family protein [Sedimenticola thiotaurini]|uniref:Sel1 repeat family protein n=1 Tax=Sedimenticola thiotaurini TaxID=1543721 RepID=A0A831RMG7_9GAMM|nr:sel1 repeat family protein [Sedimenticola thiotaurini]
MKKRCHTFARWSVLLLAICVTGAATGDGRRDEVLGDRYLHPPADRLPDQVDAQSAYLDAAEKGDPEAWGKLGTLYLLGGGGVRIDFKAARYWLQKAAQAGIPEAQYRLGTIYAEALGTPYDWPRAKHWLEAAIRGGSEAAADYLRDHAPRSGTAR